MGLTVLIHLERSVPAERLIVLQLDRVVRHFRQPFAVQLFVFYQLALLLSQCVLLGNCQVHFFSFELVVQRIINLLSLLRAFVGGILLVEVSGLDFGADVLECKLASRFEMTLLAVELGTRVAYRVLCQARPRRQAIHAVEVWDVRPMQIDAAVEPRLPRVGTRGRLLIQVKRLVIHGTLVNTVRIGVKLWCDVVNPLHLLHLLHEVFDRLALSQRLRVMGNGRGLGMRVALL